MKKTVLLVLTAFAFTMNSQAQFKQAGGENNLQLLFNPLSVTGSPIISLNNGIAYRKFNATGTSAWRVALSISSNKTTNVLQQGNDTIAYPTSSNNGAYILTTGMNPQADERISNFAFSLRPGYEKHFAGTDRLSPYLGAELIFAMSTTKAETDIITTDNYTAVFTDDFSVPTPTFGAPYVLNKIKSKTGSTTLGLNLVGGFDFYFAKNLSLGAEVNFGYYHTGLSDRESEYLSIDVSQTSVTAANFITTTTVTSTNTVKKAPDQRQGGNSGFSPGVLGFIKLGWLF